MSNEKYTHLAVCPFCGQAMQVELSQEFPSKAELVEAAIQNCECFEAGRAVVREKRLAEAKEAIEIMYGAEEDADLRDLIVQVVRMIVMDKIETAKIAVGYKRAVTIKERNGKVQITEIRREAATEEV